MNKLTSIITFSVIILASIGLLIWIAGPDDISDGADNTILTKDLITNEPFFDFGSISMAAGVVSHEFKIRNTGSNEIIIEQIYTSCMCTEASFVKGDINMGPFGMPGHGFIPKINGVVSPGEEVVVKVDFDPAAHGPAGIGPADRTVYVIPKGDNRPVELQFKVFVTP